MVKGCIYTHQGWADIVVCLSLINHYHELFDELAVLVRSDAALMTDFYIRTLPNVYTVPIETDNGRFYGRIDTESSRERVVGGAFVEIPSDYSILFHDAHDGHRRDRYKSFSQKFGHSFKSNHFAKNFYEYYDIPYSYRTTKFSVKRDRSEEEQIYIKFVEQYGEKYIVYHDDESNHLHGSHHISTKLKINSDLPKINLNKITYKFFDYLSVIERAQEIHLIDSVWACLIYQFDARYNLLGGKSVHLYALRGHTYLFEPKLENWIICESH